MKKTLLFICSMMIFSCTNRSINDRYDTPERYLKYSTTSQRLPQEVYKNPQIIPLETSDSCLIGEMSNLMVCDNMFFISGVQSGILKFKDNGTFDRKIGKLGGSPTEYTSFNDIDIDTVLQQIMIQDLHKIISYDYDGRFVKSISYDIPAFSFTKNNNYYWFYTGRNKAYSNYMLCKADSALQNKTDHLEQHSNLLPMIGKNWNKGFRTTFSENFMNRVYYIKDENLICSYEIDFGSLSIPMEVYTVSAFEALPILQNKHYAMIERYLDNGNYAFFLISEHKPSEDVKFYHWIIDKNDQNRQEFVINLHNISTDSYLFNPQSLAQNNTLYFLGYPILDDKNDLTYENENPSVISINLDLLQ